MKNLMIAALCVTAISANAQSVFSVNPNSANQGEFMTVEVSGSNTTFSSATNTYTWLSQGTSTVILPDSISVLNNVLIRSFYSFSYDDQPGLYQVNAIGASPLAGGFTLNAGQFNPSILSVNPDSVLMGDVITQQIAGEHTNFSLMEATQGSGTAALYFTQGSGVGDLFPTYANPFDDQSMEVVLSVPPTAATGMYHLQGTNTLDGTYYLVNALKVYAGQIGGIINEGAGKNAAGAPIPNINVYLLDENDQNMGTDLTDGNGEFLFTNLPKGEYRLFLDEAGADNSNPPSFSIQPTDPDLETAIVLADNTIYISSVETWKDETVISLFPNPAKDGITLQVTSGMDQQLNYDVYGLNGQKVAGKQVSIGKGVQAVSIPLEQLPAGTYFMHVHNSQCATVEKFVKY